MFSVDYSDPNLTANIQSNILNYGVCVVTGVLDNNECINMVNGMVNTLTYVTADLDEPFDINNPGTYKTLKKNLLPKKGKLYQNWGLGQAQFCWDVRCNPKIIDVFSRICGTDDLTVSMDGFSFIPPPEANNDHFSYQSQHNYHIDQSGKKPNLESVQGWVTALDVEDGDATLVAMICSHFFHSEYCKTYNLYPSSDWISLKNDHLDFFKQKGCYEHRFTCPKGSLVLWDSRTVHYGSGPLVGRPNPKFRSIIYVCYTPSNLMTERYRKRKIEIFESRGSSGYRRMTTHCPHKPHMHDEIPRLYGREKPKIRYLPDPVIHPQYLKLIGYR